jgi:U3 small nucleolar RNA-associated protein 6
MGDSVTEAMEKMIPELIFYQNENIFSTDEIKEIVKERRKFEYRIRRLKPNLVDFLSYIAFCLETEKIRQERFEQRNFTKENRFTGAIRNKISYLYNLALDRFPSNLAVWVQIIKHNSNSIKKLREILHRALRFHSLQPDLWILAANYEFERGNMTSVRSLLQRGIRTVKNSKELWLSYLKFELKYLEVLRREVDMGLDLGLKATPAEPLVPSSAPLGTEESTEDSQVVQQLKLEEQNIPKATGKDQLENPFLKGSLVKILYKHITQEFASDIDFRVDAVLLMERFKFMEPLVDACFDGLLEEGGQGIVAYCLRPFKREVFIQKRPDLAGKKRKRSERYHLDKGAHESFELFEKHLKDVTDPKIWTRYVTFLSEARLAVSEHNLFTQKQETLLKNLEEKGLLEEASAIEWLNLLLNQRKYTEAEKVGSRMSKLLGFSKPILELLLQIFEEHFLSSQSSFASTSSKFEAEIERISSKLYSNKDVAESLLLLVWQRYFMFCFDYPPLEYQSIYPLLKKCASDARLKKRGDILKVQLPLILVRFGLAKVREFYDFVLQQPYLMESFVLECISLEESFDNVDIQRVRNLFGIATNLFGTASTDLWLRYYQFEQNINGNLKRALEVYNQASLALKNSTRFSYLISMNRFK